MEVVQSIILMVLLFLSGFFSGSEVALVSLSKIKVSQMVEKKKIGAKYVQKLKANPNRMLATILLGNNVVNIAASALTTAIMLELFGNYAIGIATGVMTLLVLIFGEITPKSMAASNNEFVSRVVAAPIYYLGIILSPVLTILEMLINIIPKVFGIKHHVTVVTQEDIMSMVNLAEEEGSLKKSAGDLLTNIIEFEDKNVGDIVVPKSHAEMMNIKCNVSEALKIFAKRNRLRIPVYEKSKDNVVGVVYVKDLVHFVSKKSIPISKVMKAPFFVPETVKLSRLLKKFQKGNEQMAIIVDEYGAVIGLVTIEDILEEIVGDIKDESEANSAKIMKLNENSWLVDADTDVDEVNDKLKLNLVKKEFNSLGGFILAKMGRIPKEGDEIVVDGYTFKINMVEGHRVSKILVEKN